MKEQNKDISRAYLVFIVTCLGALMVAVKLFMVQWAEAPEWKEMADNFVTEYRSIDAVRGNILSDDGSLLATSVPLYDIRIDMAAEGLKKDLYKKGIDSLCLQLAELFKESGRSAADYKKGLNEARKEGNRYYLIKRGVKYHQIQVAKNFPIFREGRNRGGVIYEKENKRIYPFGELAKRTIGYAMDGVSPVGLEGAYAYKLSGVNGKRLERRLVGGQWMPIRDGNEIEPQDGYDLVSTIDINIQDVAESALMRQLQEAGAHHGCAILMEVKTGHIKAIANLTYDDKSQTYVERYNYAVGEATEPGSTFKLPALLAVMEEGLVKITDSVRTGDGKRKYFDRVMHDSNDKGYGKITVKRAFEVSSNVGVSSVIYDGFRKDPQRFIDRLHTMGLGRTLGIDIKGEGVPVLKNTKDKSWSGVTLPWMSIGYETMMTPLQILSFYNAVANDGVMVRPLFISEIRDEGEVIWSAEPVVLNPAIASKQNLSLCREMLEGVVTQGTASNLKNTQYNIAGKTGTAQIANRELGGYGNKGERSYLASFCGYFPAEAPEYSIIVMVTAPSNHVYYGNLVAGPVFKEIADKVFAKRFDLQRVEQDNSKYEASRIPISKDGRQGDLNMVFSELGIMMHSADPDADWVRTETKENRVDALAQMVKESQVPNVKGMPLVDALYILENQGLLVKMNGKGIVKNQSLLPGTPIRKGMNISLELAL
jgi:cell division protein FtsI (penicillin-binding protein 3)